MNFDKHLFDKITALEERIADLERVETFRTAWQTWTPTYSAIGSMTYTSVTTTFARYMVFGRMILFEIRAIGTTGGTASSGLIATLPVNKSSSTSILCAGGWNETGDASFYVASVVLTQSAVQIYKYDRANFGLGTGRVMAAQGFYEI